MVLALTRPHACSYQSWELLYQLKGNIVENNLLSLNISAVRLNHSWQSSNENASPLDFNPKLQELWTAHPREREFGSRTGAFFTHFTRGYKDGLQPETLADGNWLVKQKQPVSKIETKSDTNLRSLYESWLGMHWSQNQSHFTKPALTTKMFAFDFEISQRQKCATCHSSTSKAKHNPCQHGTCACILVVWNKAAREQLITNKNLG